MRLLILGGTRFLGRATAQAAIAAGDEVVCAARGKSGSAPDGCTFVTMDRSLPDAYDALRGDFDAVVDVSNRPSHVRAALAALGDRVGHWVYVSSVSAYSDNATPGLTPATGETHDPAPLDVDEDDLENFGPCKVAAERAVLDAVGADRAFICRAGLIVGPEDSSGRFTYWPARIARGGSVIAPGTRSDPVQWVDVRDLADWLVHAARERVSGIFDGMCEPVGRGDFLDEIVNTVGPAGTELVWIDRQFLEQHEVNSWFGPRSLPMWLPVPEYAGMLCHDGGPARTAGLACRDLADTVRSTLAWQRATSPALACGLTADEEASILDSWRAASSST
ncbi:MAG TPA: NAD-dependent epimerase/dehydratase family protein [Micromonosporaceae bacterium]